MGGSDKTTKQSSQQTTGSQQQTSQLTPWAGTGDLLGNLLGSLRGQPINLSGTESGALDLLSGMGTRGNRFAPAIGGVADTLLAGGGPDRTPIVQDAYNTLLGRLTPTASGEFLDPSTNPFFAQTTGNISRDAEARIRNLYAGSGRDPTGAGSYGYSVGRGVGEATAPVYAGVYNAERDRQLGAIRDLFGAGGSTASLLSGLDQTRLGNMQAGIGAAGAANEAEQYGPLLTLAAEAQRRGIPLQTLAQQMGLVLPAAQAFGPQSVSGTTSGTATGTETSETKKDPLSQAIGAGIGGLGLLGGLGAFGPAGWLFSKPAGGTGLLNFAQGGRPPLGVPSLVGEEGPELFVPDQPGTVVPLPSPDPRTPDFIVRAIHDYAQRVGRPTEQLSASDIVNLQRMLGVTAGRPSMR